MYAEHSSALEPLMTAYAPLDPRDPAALAALADAEQRAGRLAEAAILLTAAEQQAPDRAEAARKARRDGGALETPRFDLNSETVQTAFRSLNAAFRDGRHEQAWKESWVLVWRDPRHGALWRLVGEAAYSFKHTMLAIACARAAVAVEPEAPEGWKMLAICLSASGASDEALAMLLLAITDGVSNPSLIGLAHRYAAERHALERLELALSAAPADPARLLGLARIASHRGETETAERLCQEATRSAPEDADLHCEVGRVLDGLVDDAALQRFVESAADLLTSRSDGRFLRASAALKRGDAQTARVEAQAGLALNDGRRPPHDLMSLEARAADRSGDPDALDAALRANARFEAAQPLGRHDHRVMLERVRVLREFLQNDAAPVTSGADSVRMAFIIGFPRSGTTLLDSVLRSHSRIEVLEERPVLDRAAAQVVPETQSGEAWFKHLMTADPADLRRAYLGLFEQFLGRSLEPETVHIDKLPLNIAYAGVLHRMFPDALFIPVIRHPFDAALSNLFQNYAPNHAMMAMTRLERIDALYDACFSNWREVVERRAPRVAELRYEEMIADLEGSVSAVMSALGLDWEPAQARYFETAKARGRISTPSASQVNQPLYTRSVERWRRYADAFKGPDTARLRSWAERFGYAVD